MASRLINVRLNPEDAQLAQTLRARGISISDVMRRALRTEAAKLTTEPIDTDRLIEKIIAEHPTPVEQPAKQLDATDRRVVQAHIRRRLRAGR